MRIDFQEEGDVSIVRLEGRFTTGSDVEYVRVKEGLSQLKDRHIVVDCSAVPYLDSTALNFAVGLYTAVKKAGGKLALCGLNTRMQEVLRITHLDEIIPLYADCESALAALAAPSSGRAEPN